MPTIAIIPCALKIRLYLRQYFQSKFGLWFFLLGVLGGLLALVQVRFFGYAVGLGWPVRGLGSNSAVNADGLQPPVTLVR